MQIHTVDHQTFALVEMVIVKEMVIVMATAMAKKRIKSQRHDRKSTADRQTFALVAMVIVMELVIVMEMMMVKK